MQRVFCVKFTGDGSYVISGSDDTNLRLWKAKASEQLGVVSWFRHWLAHTHTHMSSLHSLKITCLWWCQILPREKKKHEYHEAIKKRYGHLPEVNRIARHRHLPRPVYKAAALMRTMAIAKKRKHDRRKAHSAPGSVTTKPLRVKRIVKEVEWDFCETMHAEKCNRYLWNGRSLYTDLLGR